MDAFQLWSDESRHALEKGKERRSIRLSLSKPRRLAKGDKTAMSTKGTEKLFRLALIPLTAVVLVASGCTSSMTSGTQSNVPTGSAFLVGTDRKSTRLKSR